MEVMALQRQLAEAQEWHGGQLAAQAGMHAQQLAEQQQQLASALQQVLG